MVAVSLAAAAAPLPVVGALSHHDEKQYIPAGSPSRILSPSGSQHLQFSSLVLNSEQLRGVFSDRDPNAPEETHLPFPDNFGSQGDYETLFRVFQYLRDFDSERGRALPKSLVDRLQLIQTSAETIRTSIERIEKSLWDSALGQLAISIGVPFAASLAAQWVFPDLKKYSRWINAGSVLLGSWVNYKYDLFAFRQGMAVTKLEVDQGDELAEVKRKATKIFSSMCYPLIEMWEVAKFQPPDTRVAEVAKVFDLVEKLASRVELIAKNMNFNFYGEKKEKGAGQEILEEFREALQFIQCDNQHMKLNRGVEAKIITGSPHVQLIVIGLRAKRDAYLAKRAARPEDASLAISAVPTPASSPFSAVVVTGIGPPPIGAAGEETPHAVRKADYSRRRRSVRVNGGVTPRNGHASTALILSTGTPPMQVLKEGGGLVNGAASPAQASSGSSSDVQPVTGAGRDAASHNGSMFFPPGVSPLALPPHPEPALRSSGAAVLTRAATTGSLHGMNDAAASRNGNGSTHSVSPASTPPRPQFLEEPRLLMDGATLAGATSGAPVTRPALVIRAPAWRSGGDGNGSARPDPFALNDVVLVHGTASAGAVSGSALEASAAALRNGSNGNDSAHFDSASSTPQLLPSEEQPGPPVSAVALTKSAVSAGVASGIALHANAAAFRDGSNGNGSAPTSSPASTGSLQLSPGTSKQSLNSAVNGSPPNRVGNGAAKATTRTFQSGPRPPAQHSNHSSPLSPPSTGPGAHPPALRKRFANGRKPPAPEVRPDGYREDGLNRIPLRSNPKVALRSHALRGIKGAALSSSAAAAASPAAAATS